MTVINVLTFHRSSILPRHRTRNSAVLHR